MASKLLKILFFGLLLIATHQSLVPKPASIFDHIWDKYLHLGCWSGLALSLYAAYSSFKSIALKWVCLFLYSILIEMGQKFVPGRTFSGEDILMNGLGILLVYGLVQLKHRLQSRTKS